MLQFSYKKALLNKTHLTIEDVIIKEENIQVKNIKKTVEVKNIKKTVEVKEDPSVIKKKVSEIFVVKDSIPSKEDIMRLCSHGMYLKMKNIHFSHFTEENIKFYIYYMHHKINEIKVWRNEGKNDNESSKKRFKNRIDNIYKTINLMKSKHLEYIGNTIMENKVDKEVGKEEGKWEKVGKN